MNDQQKSTDSTNPHTENLSRRERLSLLCSFNEGYLQYQAETLLQEMGWALSTAMLAFIKVQTGNEISRKNLGRLPQWFLANRISDEQFDRSFNTLSLWIGRL